MSIDLVFVLATSLVAAVAAVAAFAISAVVGIALGRFARR